MMLYHQLQPHHLDLMDEVYIASRIPSVHMDKGVLFPSVLKGMSVPCSHKLLQLKVYPWD